MGYQAIEPYAQLTQNGLLGQGGGQQGGGSGSVAAGKVYTVNDQTLSGGLWPTTTQNINPNVGEHILFQGAPSNDVKITLPATANDGESLRVTRVTKVAADRYGFPDVRNSAGTILYRRVAPNETLTFTWRNGGWQLSDSSAGMGPLYTYAAQDTTQVPSVAKLTGRETYRMARTGEKVLIWTDATSKVTGAASAGSQTVTKVYGAGFSTGNVSLTSPAAAGRGIAMTAALPAAVDLTGQAVFATIMIPEGQSGLVIDSIRIVAGNSTDFTNSSVLECDADKLLYGTYIRIGGNEWTTTGTGANLSAVTHLKVSMGVNTVAATFELVNFGSYKPNPKSVIVMCLDGTASSKFDAEIPLMLSKGCRATYFPGIQNEIDSPRFTKLADYGWEMGIRSLINASKDGLEASGVDLARETQEILDISARAGINRPIVAGQWSNTGTFNMSALNVSVIKQFVHGVRRYYTAKAKQRCVWPPVEFMSIPSYGMTDLVTAKAIVDDAVANPGTMAVITFHYVANSIAEFLDYVIPMIAAGQIEMRTLGEALTGPVPVVASGGGVTPGPWIKGTLAAGCVATATNSEPAWRLNGSMVDVFIGQVTNNSGSTINGYTTYATKPASIPAPYAGQAGQVNTTCIFASGNIGATGATDNGGTAPSYGNGNIVSYRWQ